MNNVTSLATASPDLASFKDLSNALRFLAIDAVQKANSGHPGMPMGMADVATVLFSKFIKIDPKNPNWPNRDRFVLSAGHGSMLLYGLNHLLGYDKMTLEQLKNFRQLGSHTAGHPEHDISMGIEMTTGPLGQGFATSVGMAIAETHLGAKFGNDLVNHHTYVIASDGDLMEGISHEAASLAGHLKLSKLIVLLDDNEITIDGSIKMSCSDDVIQRFLSYQWHVQSIDGHDETQIENAIQSALSDDRPSLIACKTKIGKGSPHKEGSSAAHGSPLGEEEVKLTRENLGWHAAPFEIPTHIAQEWARIGARSSHLSKAWDALYKNHPDKDLFMQMLSGKVEEAVFKKLDNLKAQALKDKPSLATRESSGQVINAIFDICPSLIGGSADLTPSNNTRSKEAIDYAAENHLGRYLRFGIREHAMAAVMNGLALHGGMIPFGGTFLTFSDYCRPAIRLSALMKQRVIYIMTHDSIGLGEDGPTHQPVEHLAALRAIPNLTVFRPADLVETIEAWDCALKNTEGPTLIALSRQKLPALRLKAFDKNLSNKGAYLLADFGEDSAEKISLYATGSEVQIAIEAHEALKNEGIASRVISVPSWEKFSALTGKEKEEILCHKGPKIAIEAACSMGWEKFIGAHGCFIGMNGFGLSAPASDLYEHFGITSKNIIRHVKSVLKK